MRAVLGEEEEEGGQCNNPTRRHTWTGPKSLATQRRVKKNLAQGWWVSL